MTTYSSKSSTKFVTQCAAVNTYWLLITDPEHRYETSCDAEMKNTLNEKFYYPSVEIRKGETLLTFARYHFFLSS